MCSKCSMRGENNVGTITPGKKKKKKKKKTLSILDVFSSLEQCK